MGMMSMETGDLLGEQIGEVLDVDLDDDGNAMGEFMRIKVRMDITSPIMRFVTLELEEDEEDQRHVHEEMMGDDEEDKEGKKRKKRENCLL